MADATARPTIRTVAARAGVSKSLVSLVLQGSPRVGAQSRAAIEAAIEELGYRPNLVARSLSSQRTGVVGVVMNDLRNPWFVDCFEGFASVAGHHGYRPLLADLGLDTAAEGTLVDAILRLHVDGLVLMGTMEPTPALRQAVRDRPTVVAAARDIREARVDVIVNDDDAGVGLALDHLIGLGHRRIVHVSGGPGAVSAVRRAAFERRMVAAGLEPRVVVGGTTEDDGRDAARALLTGTHRPTAVLAFNDVCAIGVLAAARERGIEVPGELSVVGYDNSVLARLGIAELTSIDASSAEVGRLAAEALLRRMEKPASPRRETLVAPRLVARASTGPAPDAP